MPLASVMPHDDRLPQRHPHFSQMLDQEMHDLCKIKHATTCSLWGNSAPRHHRRMCLRVSTNAAPTKTYLICTKNLILHVYKYLATERQRERKREKKKYIHKKQICKCNGNEYSVIRKIIYSCRQFRPFAPRPRPSPARLAQKHPTSKSLSEAVLEALGLSQGFRV